MLSKSQYTRGLQCLKSLWLYRNRRDLRSETPASLQGIFDQGHLVGELARRRFPGGTLIEEDHLHMREAIRSTRKAVESGTRVLYEAALVHENVLVRPDILLRAEDGDGWDLIEVKSSAGVKDVYVEDAAVQRFVLEGAGFPLRACFIMHLNAKYVRTGKLDLEKLFTLAAVAKETAALQTKIPLRLSAMRKAAGLKTAPETAIGPHCSSPYDCDFMDHCWAAIPDYSVFDLVRIRHGQAQALADRGILLIRDVPDDFPLSKAQKLQVSLEKSGVAQSDAKAIAKDLEELVYPLHYLDFETVNPALPPFDGTRPFQPLPFQASLRVQDSPGSKARHFEFLADPGLDPRPALARFLAENIGPIGSLVAYAAGFEKARLSDLAADVPSHSKELNSMKNRLWDIGKPFAKGHFLHPAFRGSWSIKAVLPALVPELSYDALEIKNGDEASRAYLAAMEGRLTPEEVEKTLAALKEYCGLDTLAMVRVMEVLREASVAA